MQNTFFNEVWLPCFISMQTREFEFPAFYSGGLFSVKRKALLVSFTKHSLKLKIRFFIKDGMVKHAELRLHFIKNDSESK